MNAKPPNISLLPDLENAEPAKAAKPVERPKAPPVVVEKPTPSVDTDDDCSEFKWSDVGDSIIYRGCETTAVYVNPHGDIVIRSERTWDRDEDTVIVIPRFYAEPVAMKINDLLAEGWPDDPQTKTEARSKARPFDK